MSDLDDDEIKATRKMNGVESNLSEEEEECIEKLFEYSAKYICAFKNEDELERIFNARQLIKKQQKELEQEKEKNKLVKQLYDDACKCIATECIEKDKIKEVINICNSSSGEFVTLPNGEEICISDNQPILLYLEELLEE